MTAGRTFYDVPRQATAGRTSYDVPRQAAAIGRPDSRPDVRWRPGSSRS